MTVIQVPQLSGAIFLRLVLVYSRIAPNSSYFIHIFFIAAFSTLFSIICNKSSSIAAPKVTFERVCPPVVGHAKRWNFRSTVQALTGQEGLRLLTANIDQFHGNNSTLSSVALKEESPQEDSAIIVRSSAPRSRAIDWKDENGMSKSNGGLIPFDATNGSSRKRRKTCSSSFSVDISAFRTANNFPVDELANNFHARCCQEDKLEDLFSLPELQREFYNANLQLI
ncbi:hypothetical protein KP509_27G018300 [Ceratopteris richardii]|uniref:Uncharacterized protein n=1 Tax=Ceratopteris richardii TaxID=49495 RepID=A0A8T2RFP8_CERRI|nr:hypothetical protein KP509_27G018300 [Ceratopteris richardii]